MYTYMYLLGNQVKKLTKITLYSMACDHAQV